MLFLHSVQEETDIDFNVRCLEVPKKVSIFMSFLWDFPSGCCSRILCICWHTIVYNTYVHMVRFLHEVKRRGGELLGDVVIRYLNLSLNWTTDTIRHFICWRVKSSFKLVWKESTSPMQLTDLASRWSGAAARWPDQNLFDKIRFDHPSVIESPFRLRAQVSKKRRGRAEPYSPPTPSTHHPWLSWFVIKCLMTTSPFIQLLSYFLRVF